MDSSSSISYHMSRIIKEMLKKLMEGDAWHDIVISSLLAILHDGNLDLLMNTEGGDFSMLIQYSNSLLTSIVPHHTRLVKSAFYWNPGFSSLSEVLLSIMERGSDSPASLKACDIVKATPAPIALTFLLSVITCITPSTIHHTLNPLGARVISLGADQAARLLTSRFIRGNGVEELVLYLSYQESQKGCDEWPDALLPPYYGYSMDSDTIAGQISSLHEHVPLTAPEPDESWFSLIIKSLFRLLGQPQSYWSESNQSIPVSMISQPALDLLANIIKRACSRGHSRPTAMALIISHSKEIDTYLTRLMQQLVSFDSRCLGQLAGGLIWCISSQSSFQVPDQPEDQYRLIQEMRDGGANSHSLLSSILGGDDVLKPHLQDIQYCLLDQMLLGSKTLSNIELFILTSFLSSDYYPCPLSNTIKKVSSVWSDRKLLTLTSITQQGYLTHALALLLSHFIRKGSDLDSLGSFLPLLLKGVSDRFGESLVAQRRQAMRVGRLVSLLTLSESSEPLFQEQMRCGELNWSKEELWEGAFSVKSKPLLAPVTIPDPQMKPKISSPAALMSVERLNKAITLAEADSDNDSDEDGDDFPSYDISESKEVEEELNADPKSLQLRSIASSLKKADDYKLVLKSLQRLEALVRCQPEELVLSAPDLIRSLLHCRIPEWAEKEAKSNEEDPQMQRIKCLIALISLCPVASGDTVLSELYSPHLDTFQRLLILDTLKSAAEEMTGSAASITGGSFPNPSARSSALEGPSSSAGVGKTRVWGKVALRKRAEPLPATHTNRFTSFALRWASSILRSIDVVSHGVELLNRDSIVLGRALSTLASFAEYASHTSASLPLAVSILELIKIPQIHQHPDPFIRRAALLAAGQVLASLPPSSVAQAMLLSDHHHEREESSKSLIGGLDLSSIVKLPSLDTVRIQGKDRGIGKWDAQDEALLCGLEFIQSWARKATEGDIDPTCKAMAGACVNIQAGLAKQAIQQLANSRDSDGSKGALM